jgi:hypothetical protein
LMTGMQHLPASQVLPVGHARPQEPQLFQSVRRSTHVPLQLIFPRISQFTGGFVTVTAGFGCWTVMAVQTPFRQDAGDWHVCKHEPQCREFVLRSTHVPPQLVSPIFPQSTGGLVTLVAGTAGDASGATQIPFRHDAGGRQAFPQEPQLSGSVRGSTHTSLQLMYPARQVDGGTLMFCPGTSSRERGVATRTVRTASEVLTGWIVGGVGCTTGTVSRTPPAIAEPPLNNPTIWAGIEKIISRMLFGSPACGCVYLEETYTFIPVGIGGVWDFQSVPWAPITNTPSSFEENGNDTAVKGDERHEVLTFSVWSIFPFTNTDISASYSGRTQSITATSIDVISEGRI